MHIAFVSPGWPLKRFPNGVVTYVHWMREELRQQGHYVSVFTGAGAVPEDDVFLIRRSLQQRWTSWLASKLFVSPSPVFQWGDSIARAVRATNRRHPIDVIEMEESFGWAVDVMQRTSIPTVVKLHGPAFMTLPGEQSDAMFAKVKIEREGAGLRRVQVLTSPSKRTLESTIDHYRLAPASSRQVVNPLSLPSSAPLWDLGRCDRRSLLFVGRFDTVKGGDIVLLAFARLLKVNPDLKLTFVGPDAGVPGVGGENIMFHEFVSGLFSPSEAARVDYRGGLAPEEIYVLRAQALVTIVASRRENQSYTALEAMLQSCPLVSSNAGGQSEIVADGITGLLAATGSVEDLCAKIQVLIDNPQRAAELGRRARAYVLERHSPSRVAAETLAAYHDAIALAQQGGMRGRRNEVTREHT